MNDSLEEQVRTLREGCGLTEPSGRGLLEISGKDRLRFLHAYVTCDVKGLAPGQGAYGFFTSAQGRILSDAVLLALDDRLWVEVGPGQETPIADHLRKFILADRVEIRPLDEMATVTLVGPRTPEILGHDLSGLDAPWKHAPLLDGLLVQRRGRMGAPAWTVWAPAAEETALRERLTEAGARPVDAEALDVLRTEEGIPSFGQDFGPDNFPQETGIEDAVSYTKGCYLGQEIVARIHYRGGVQKTLCGLWIEGEVAPGAALLHEGRPAGAATTVVRSPAQGRTLGLGILHKRASEPGTRLEVEGGGAAEVRPPVLRP
jgi:folate-binding protein YgfZ